ncbi:unnamed protein product [Urochloa humidicola]
MSSNAPSPRSRSPPALPSRLSLDRASCPLEQPPGHLETHPSSHPLILPSPPLMEALGILSLWHRQRELARQVDKEYKGSAPLDTHSVYEVIPVKRSDSGPSIRSRECS